MLRVPILHANTNEENKIDGEVLIDLFFNRRRKYNIT
jgi:hypothetical protein